MREHNGIKIGIEYFPGDSGGYYKLYYEKMGEQFEQIIPWDEVEIIRKAIRSDEI